MKNTTCIWQGFSHKWDGRPHRMGDFANFIKDSEVTDTGSIRIDAKASSTFKPGQDGDRATIKLFYEPVHQPNIGITRGHWVETIFDAPSTSRTDQLALTSLTEARNISTQNAELNFGNFDNYSVVLRGFEIDLTDQDSDATGYIWPTSFKIDITSATLSADRQNINCSIAIVIQREDSPDSKNASSPMRYDLKIFYTVIGGDALDFQEGTRHDFSVSNIGHEDGSRLVTQSFRIHPSILRSVTGIVGFSFSIKSDLDRDGRYIKYYELFVEDEPIDGNGNKEVNARLGIHTDPSITIYAAKYDAKIRTVQLQFKRLARGLTLTKNAEMDVCTMIGVEAFHCPVEKTSDTQTVSHTL